VLEGFRGGLRSTVQCVPLIQVALAILFDRGAGRVLQEVEQQLLIHVKLLRHRSLLGLFELLLQLHDVGGYSWFVESLFLLITSLPNRNLLDGWWLGLRNTAGGLL